MSNKTRVVIALPDPSECSAVASWLAAEGYEPVVRPSAQLAADEMHSRAFDLLVADETFVFRCGLRPGGRIRNGRVPVVVIGGAPDAPAADAYSAQVMYLTRPVDRTVLSCFVSMAILDGRPARRSVRKPVSRFDVFANGLPVRLIDVSNEGMRIEMPPGRMAPLSPVFNVRIPFMGVAVTARRMWTRPQSVECPATSYGAALADNRSVVERAWRSFVETVPVGPATDPMSKG